MGPGVKIDTATLTGDRRRDLTPRIAQTRFQAFGFALRDYAAGALWRARNTASLSLHAHDPMG